MTDLEKYINDIEKKEDDGFQVIDRSSAQWATNKAIYALQKIVEIEDSAKLALEAAKQKISEYVESATKEHKETLDRMSEYLKPWVSVEIAASKNKSIALIGATVGFRANPDNVNITANEKDLIEKIEKDYPEAIITKKTLSKRVLKKLLKSGEIIDGISLVKEPDTFVIKETK